jgi:hypothetical protein
MEAYGNAQKEWEENTKKTLANNQMEIEKYKEIIENKKLNIDQMAAGLTLAAQPFQNKLMFDYAQEKNINGALNLYDKMVGIQEKAESSFSKLLGFNENDKASLKSTIDQYNSNPDQLAGLTNQQYQALRLAGERFPDLPKLNNPTVMLKGGGGAPGSDQVQAAVDMVGQYKENLATAMSKMPAQLKATFQQQLLAQYPDYDQKQFNAENAGATSYQRAAGSQGARIESASNEVEQLLPQAIEASRALPRGKFVPWNKLSQQWEAGTSDPAYNDFAIANFGLTSAYVRAMNPTGNPRIADRFEVKANNILSLATDQKSYEVQAARLWKEVQASKIAVAKTSQGRTGGDINAPMPESGAQDSGVIRYDAQGNRVQ